MPGIVRIRLSAAEAGVDASPATRKTSQELKCQAATED
jgi:hypothetical protein